MSKTALDYVNEQMFETAKKDSTSAGGWEAIEDLARLKISTQFNDRFLLAVAEYLKTQPYPEDDQPTKQ